jgi:hypothetical protein
MNIINKSNVPFQTIHIDHLGPLEKTNLKNVHIFAIIDAFTKYINIYATKTTNSKEVIKFLKDYFTQYSVPERIISDRGSAFTSKDFERFVKEVGCKHVLIATASPQSNGQIERYNKSLVPLIAKLVEETGKSWDKLLVDAQFLLNNTFNRSINNVPSKLLYGIIQKRKIDNNLITFCEELNSKSNIESLEEIRTKSSECIEKLQKYNKIQFDKRSRKQTTYLENDLVSIRTTNVPGENNKLKSKFRGPYLVKKVLDKNRYLITDVEGYQVTDTNLTNTTDEDSDNEIELEDLEYLDDEFYELN